jgi:Holliday junction resolvase-like predicted endonuclease
LDILKSSRHSKITGDYGEALVLYWLSKYGFERARVDYTGIDLIARNPHTQELMGISVKSRSRTLDTERSSLRISSDNFEKASRACEEFRCVPYFAIVTDSGEMTQGFLLPMEHLLRRFPSTNSGVYWKMGERYVKQFMNDPEVRVFELQTKTVRWW